MTKMNKHTQGVVVVLAVVTIAAAAYHFFHNKSRRFAKIIIDFNGSTGSLAELMNMMEQDFLQAWAKALMKGKTDFSYKGEYYNTKGGAKIVNK